MPNKNKICFFGTPEFATKTLDALELAGYEIAGAVTRPDRPIGRQHILTPSPVKHWAIAHKVAVFTDLRDPSLPVFDLGIVVAYGNILPKEILEIPKLGMINVHYSLLPRYRGASPVQASLLAGDRETGVTIALLEEKLDSGPILAEAACQIAPNDTYATLHPRLVELGNALLIPTLEKYLSNQITARAQDSSMATYCKKISTADGLINLADPIRTDRIVRALNPNPGAYFFHDGRRIKVLSGRIESNIYVPERIIPEGKREMGWMDFKRGNL